MHSLRRYYYMKPKKNYAIRVASVMLSSAMLLAGCGAKTDNTTEPDIETVTDDSSLEVETTPAVEEETPVESEETEAEETEEVTETPVEEVPDDDGETNPDVTEPASEVDESEDKSTDTKSEGESNTGTTKKDTGKTSDSGSKDESKQSEKVSSKITISAERYPTGTIASAPFVLSGVISSNAKLTSVTATLYKDGVAEQTATVNPNATSFSIKSSTLDKNIRFAKTTAGNYTLVYTATDENGYTQTWTSPVFVVAGEETGTTPEANATTPSTPSTAIPEEVKPSVKPSTDNNGGNSNNNTIVTPDTPADDKDEDKEKDEDKDTAGNNNTDTEEPETPSVDDNQTGGEDNSEPATPSQPDNGGEEETPSTPETPDTGDNGNETETPDTGDNGNEAETPDAGDNSENNGSNVETPSTPDTGDNTTTPDVDNGTDAETPDVENPETPETPDVENPETPEVPDTGDNGNETETPDTGDDGNETEAPDPDSDKDTDSDKDSDKDTDEDKDSDKDPSTDTDNSGEGENGNETETPVDPEPETPVDPEPETPDHEHEYELVGYELLNGGTLLPYSSDWEGFAYLEPSTPFPNAIFVIGYNEDGSPVVKYLDDLNLSDEDGYMVANVLDDNGNAAYAKGYECRQYAYDGTDSTDYKVYFANLSWATPEDAVVAPSQQESGDAWDAHFDAPDSHCAGFTGSFKEYIYQIVKPVYKCTCGDTVNHVD
jgi:hypothetical protein